jgi:hypothetical protein
MSRLDVLKLIEEVFEGALVGIPGTGTDSGYSEAVAVDYEELRQRLTKLIREEERCTKD